VDPETILQLAQQFSEREDYPRALEEYGKLLALNPADTRILLRVGDLQIRVQNLGGAIETYDYAAFQYASQGHGLKAVAVYKQVRELVLVQEQHAPGWADRYQHVVERLCALYLELGLANDALRVLDDEAARLRNLERDEDSLYMYRRMADLAPNLPLPHLRLGEGLYRVGQLDGALTAFWSATQLLLAGSRNDDALRVLERMLHIKPLPRHAKIAARLYLEKGTEPEGKQALSRLQICFQADPSDLETLQMLSQAFAQIGQDDRAIEVQKELARLAHEQGRPDVFEETLSLLRDVAPEDEQVQALLQMAPPEDRYSRSVSSLPPSADAPGSMAPESFAPDSRAPDASPGASMAPNSIPPSSVPISLIPMSSVASAPPPAAGSATRHSPPPKPTSDHPSSYPPRTFTPPPKPGRGSSLPPQAPSSSPTAARGVAPPLPKKFRTSTPPPLPASFLQQAAAASGRPTLEAPVANEAGFVAEAGSAAAPGESRRPPPPSARRGAQGQGIASSEADARSLEAAFAAQTIAPEAGAAATFDSVSDASYQAIVERTHRALTDARAFRGLSLFHKAIELVQQALELDPRSIELRELLRDLFTDLGDRDGAIEEMLTMAEIYVEFERPDHARAVLENILDEESGCLEALEMLQRLSAAADVADRISVPMLLLETVPPSELAEGEGLPRSAMPPAPLVPDVGANFEHASTNRSSLDSDSAPADPSRQPIPPPPPSLLSATVNPPLSSRGVLAPPPPSPRSANSLPPPPARSAGFSLPPPPEPSVSSAPPVMEAAPPPAMSLDETLEEVEFFASRGLLAEAERLLNGQLQRYPDHPLLLESLQDIKEAQVDSQRAPDPSAKLDAAQSRKSGDSLDFDLQASLGELERAVRESLLPPQPGQPASNVDVDGLFERFKTTVKQQVPDADSKAHYDLGIAYKDLSLLDDAIEELNLASRDPELECKCQTLIGNIYAEQNVWDKAAKTYSRALSAMRKTKAEETALYYELGNVSEMMGQLDQSIYYFRQVLRRDQSYRDARDRVAELRTQRHRTASGRPRGADEEVDRAFEDILGD
jgi:pilus assembly protein FimV